MTRKRRAIVFDLDGTLIDSAAQIAVALNALRARRGGAPISARQARTWVSFGASRLVANALGPLAQNSATDVAEFRALYAALAPDPADVFPHVPETLAALRAQGFAMAICTAKPQALAERVVAGLGLAEHFHALVGGRPDMPAKPHPAPACEALRLIGARPEDALYVGDSEIDAQTASALGAPFLLATFGYAMGDVANIPCAARFDDFMQLPGLAARFGPDA